MRADAVVQDDPPHGPSVAAAESQRLNSPSAGRSWLRAWSWWTQGTRSWRACCRCPFSGGWRILRTVVPDELRDDAPVTRTALGEMRAAVSPFPDVPVVVLTAARGFPPPVPSGMDAPGQAELAAAAPQRRHVVVDGTGHNIPRNRPDVVAGAILEVAAQARASDGGTCNESCCGAAG